MIEFIVEPFTYPFMVRALLAVTLAAATSSLIGTFSVLKNMSYISSALSHSIVPGVAIGYMLGDDSHDQLFWWACGTSVISAVGMATLVNRLRISTDSAISIIYAGMFALGIAIISTVRGFAVDLVHILFGNVLSVTSSDLSKILIMSLIITIITMIFFKQIVIVTFDPIFAKSLRLNKTFITYLQYVLLALTVVVALQTVGIALVITLIVTPVSTALKLSKKLHYTIILAAAFGIISGIMGLYISFYANIAAGPSIALVCIMIFLFCLIIENFNRLNLKRKISAT